MGAAHCRSRTRASRSHPVTFTQSLAGIGAPLKQAKIVSCSFSLTVWHRRNLACFAKNEEVPKIDLWHRLRVLHDHVQQIEKNLLVGEDLMDSRAGLVSCFAYQPAPVLRYDRQN